MAAGSSNYPRVDRAFSVDTGATSSQHLDWRHLSGAREYFQPGADSIAEERPRARIAGDARTQFSTGHDDTTMEREFLQCYDYGQQDLFATSSDGIVATSRQTGSKVVVRRILRSSGQAARDVAREINVLCAAPDPSIPILIDSLELKDVIWTVKEHRPLQTLAELVRLHGPVPDETLRTALNQLFSGIAALFYAGFAHLRICDTTICFDERRQLCITDCFYACEYGKNKIDDLYAPTQEKYGDDLYVAPEVFAKTTYNARKATIWSCGVLIYFMTTGQTEKLSNLDHPVFENQKPRDDSTTSGDKSSKHRRKSSAAATAANIPKIIHYPNNRFGTPNYARWIIPKMLMHDPQQRAELIEIASRIPKDFDEKATRPLIELAWLDYKDHVGPLAGLNIADPTKSSRSSVYSMASNMSNPFRSLMGRGNSRRQSMPASQSGHRWA